MEPPMPTTSAPAAAARGPRPAFLAALLACVVVALYLPAVGFDFFLLDDMAYLRDNPAMERGLSLQGVGRAFTSLQGGLWIPLTWMSFMADVTLFGDGPAGFHFTNILLHAANMALLLLLLHRMTGALWPSAAAAALVALHPMRVESVAWIAERKDVLCVFLALLALFAWHRWTRGKGKAWYLASLALFTLGLMAKPVLVVMPFLMLVLDYWPLRRLGADRGDPPSPSSLLVEKIPFFALAAAFACLGIHTQSPAIQDWTGASTLPHRAGNLLQTYAHYLEKSFVPLRLFPRAVGFSRPLGIGEAAAVILALVFVSALAARLRRSAPYLIAGWCWFLLALLPHAGLLPVHYFWVGDRFSYLPHLGLAIALAWGGADAWARWGGGRVLLPVSLVIALLASLGAATRAQLRYWKDSTTLLSRGIEVSPSDAVLRLELASALRGKGRNAEALDQAILSARMDSTLSAAHRLAGMLLAESGREREARVRLEKALLLPDHTGRDADTIFALGRVHHGLGEQEKALEFFRRAARREPGNLLFRTALGDQLLSMGRFAEADACYREHLAGDADPTSQAVARTGLGRALAAAGREDEARREWEAALALNRLLAEPRYRLALSDLARGDRAGAVENLQAAWRLRPRSPELRRGLAEAFRAAGLPEEARSVEDTIPAE